MAHHAVHMEVPTPCSSTTAAGVVDFSGHRFIDGLELFFQHLCLCVKWGGGWSLKGQET